MLPVIDKPAIQYVIEEASSSGISDVLMITGRNKRPVEDHFDRAYELEDVLVEKGKLSALESVQASSRLADVHYVRQGQPLGLGHAVLCAKPHVGDQPFAVLLGDDLIDPRDRLLEVMMDVRQELGGSVLALMEVDPAQIHLYGCASVQRVPGSWAEDRDVLEILDLVEKPGIGAAPSNLAVIGRYVLDPEVFEVLQETKPGRNGEIQLTDALRVLAQRGSTVHGVVFSGRRYDTGNREDYLRSIVQLACERPDIGPGFCAWLKEYVENGLPG
ncbi:UTP--glucose-1-phosphate uridylyltransferase GalU [Streptomyces coacervatus]|uniref:UTP--glucose-1-phosphate uridylyltransferase n=2 Tax=Streptomyces coacervatus TaxID=647381 RepID=A0ABP7HKL4_9ACTN